MTRKRKEEVPIPLTGYLLALKVLHLLSIQHGDSARYKETAKNIVESEKNSKQKTALKI